MQSAEEIKAILERIPNPDQNGTYVNLNEGGIRQIEGVVEELTKGGRETVLTLAALLVEPGSGDDVKAHWALNLLAMRSARPGEQQARTDFATAVASQLGGDKPKAVRAYLIEQLQIAGGKEAVPALGRLLLDEDLCDAAARALVTIRDGAEDEFLAAWPGVDGKRRLSIVRKLGTLGSQKARSVFLEALGDKEGEIRMAAAWGLANLGDATAAESLLKASEAAEGWERSNETDACFVLAENLMAAGHKPLAARIYQHLLDSRVRPSERHVREAAQRGLTAAK